MNVALQLRKQGHHDTGCVSSILMMTFHQVIFHESALPGLSATAINTLSAQK